MTYPCMLCSGKGVLYTPYKPTDCPQCLGTKVQPEGQSEFWRMDLEKINGLLEMEAGACALCEGDGSIGMDNDLAPCPQCGGSKRQPEGRHMFWMMPEHDAVQAIRRYWRLTTDNGTDFTARRKQVSQDFYAEMQALRDEYERDVTELKEKVDRKRALIAEDEAWVKSHPANPATSS